MLTCTLDTTREQKQTPHKIEREIIRRKKQLNSLKNEVMNNRNIDIDRKFDGEMTNKNREEKR